MLKSAVMARRYTDAAGAVSLADDHARLDYGVHGLDHSAAVGLRKFHPADSTGRGGHGLSGTEHAFLLGHISFTHRTRIGIFRSGRRAPGRLDSLPTAERPGAN